MNYIIEGTSYSISYQELKEYYTIYSEYNKEEFLKNIAKILHLSCVICFFKEIPSYICLSDIGIIHELSHIIDGTYTEDYDIVKVMKLFKNQCKLV